MQNSLISFAFVVMLSFCSSASAQDEIHKFADISRAQAEIGAIEYAWSLTHPIAKEDCSVCHVGTIEPDAGSRDSWAFDYVNTLTEQGVLIGNFRVGNLQDPILRGHLQLGDVPALVVWSAPEDVKELQSGDVLLSVDGKRVEDAVSFKKAINRIDSGKITLDAVRAGKHLELSVSRELLLDKPEPTSYKIGVQVEQPSAALRSQLQLYANEGILVIDVVSESPAQKAGLKKHDILLRADSIRLTAFKDLDASVQASEGAPMKLIVLRNGKENAMLVKPIAQEKPQIKPVCPGMTADGYMRIQNHDG